MANRMKIGLLLAVVSLFGCQQIEAAFPTADAVAKVIAADVAAHDPPSQVEQDVARVLAGQVGVDVIEIIQDVARGMLALGEIAPELVAPLTALVAAEQTKAAAGMHYRIGVDHVPSASLWVPKDWRLSPVTFVAF